MRFLTGRALALLLASAGSALAQTAPATLTPEPTLIPGPSLQTPAVDPASMQITPGPSVAQMPWVAAPGGWTGAYIGINGGWVMDAADNLLNTGSDTDGGGLGNGLNVAAIPNRVNLGYNGWLLGGTAGYNWQVAPAWVLGAEFDADGGDANNNSTIGPITVPGHVPQTTTYTRGVGFLATARARAGWLPVPNVMIFGTAGLAFGQTKLGTSYICPTCAPNPTTEPNSSATHHVFGAGGVYGGGVEWMITPAWSVRAEFLQANLGSTANQITYNYGVNNTTLSSMRTTANFIDNIVRLGVDFHFAPPPP